MAERLRVAVTGASSGIGRELALALSARGCSLVLAARREALLLPLSTQCLTAGASAAVPLPCDVTEPSHCERLADVLEELGQGTAALVNNAGSALFGPFVDLSYREMKELIDVNLLGTMYATRAVLPQMLRARKGHIVNVLSISATSMYGPGAAYSAAKAGALAFARCLALDVRKQGLRVTSVLPGATDTPLWDALGGGPDRSRMLTPRAVAECVTDVLMSPDDRSFDEILMMPPEGFL